MAPVAMFVAMFGAVQQLYYTIGGPVSPEAIGYVIGVEIGIIAEGCLDCGVAH